MSLIFSVVLFSNYIDQNTAAQAKKVPFTIKDFFCFEENTSIPVMKKNELCKKEDLALKFERTVGQQNPNKNNGGHLNEFYSK